MEKKREERKMNILRKEEKSSMLRPLIAKPPSYKIIMSDPMGKEFENVSILYSKSNWRISRMCMKGARGSEAHV